MNPNPNQVSLNTSVLGLGPEKNYGGRVGAPLGRTAAVWINGEGFYNYQVSRVVSRDECQYAAPSLRSRPAATRELLWASTT